METKLCFDLGSETNRRTDSIWFDRIGSRETVVETSTRVPKLGRKGTARICFHPIPSHPIHRRSTRHQRAQLSSLRQPESIEYTVAGRGRWETSKDTPIMELSTQVFLFPLSQHVRFIQITRRLLHWLYGRNAASAESSSSSESTLIPRTSWSQLVPSAFLLLSYPPWMGYQQKT